MSPGLDSKFYSLTQYSTTAKNSQLFSFIALLSPSLILQGIIFMIMPSFLCDFAVSIGGSDSGGSIQQPLMDWEVISIDGSSSEDTRRGASNNESSSSERLGASHCTGGCTFRLHRKVQPFAASLAREFVSFMVVLPSFSSGGPRRSGGDVKSSLLVDEYD